MRAMSNGTWRPPSAKLNEPRPSVKTGSTIRLQLRTINGVSGDDILGFAQQAVGFRQRLEGPGIGPVAVVDVVLQFPPGNVGVVHGGDLELAARRRLDAADDVEDLTIEEIEAENGIGRFRFRRL